MRGAGSVGCVAGRRFPLCAVFTGVTVITAVCGCGCGCGWLLRVIVIEGRCVWCVAAHAVSEGGCA
eukprot:scaffold992_cov118-Isochrysis_galbana.AAC.7